MDFKSDFDDIKCFGSTTVGPRGQVVIPASARKELGIDAGNTLLVFRGFRGNGVLLLKVEAVERMLGMVSEHLPDFEKLVRSSKSTTTSGRKGVLK